jgi:hypothetical protein
MKNNQEIQKLYKDLVDVKWKTLEWLGELKRMDTNWVVKKILDNKPEESPILRTLEDEENKLRIFKDGETEGNKYQWLRWSLFSEGRK